MNTTSTTINCCCCCCCCCCICCCCCSYILTLIINSHNQVRGHRTGSSHSGAEENIPGKNTNNPTWYTHIISQLTQFMSPPETYKSEIGSQSTMCEVHTGAYVSILTPGETDYNTACHPDYNTPTRTREESSKVKVPYY